MDVTFTYWATNFFSLPTRLMSSGSALHRPEHVCLSQLRKHAGIELSIFFVPGAFACLGSGFFKKHHLQKNARGSGDEHDYQIGRNPKGYGAPKKLTCT